MRKKVDIIRRSLITASGLRVEGFGFGATQDTIMELVFNTSMVGYQELMSDPSYTGQMVCMTYPLIGNYGMTEEDYESKSPSLGGLIVHEYCDSPSNFRYTKTLGEVLEEYDIPGIYGVDTRRITRHIRSEGSMPALLTDAATSTEEALRRLGQHEPRRDQVATVSSRKIWYARTPNPRYDVVAIDCGIKLGIVRKLQERGCNVIVVPYDTPAADILAMRPHGVFLSNGPGDPEDVQPVIETVQALRGQVPLFGICLGHQMICLAYGGSTYKMKFGHRGGNHPVKNLLTGRVEITSQNHSYAVEAASLIGSGLTVTHKNLLDDTVEGVMDVDKQLFSVQYHPESSPGPEDSEYLFGEFIGMMEGRRHAEA